jgi:hypothetical protein
MISKAQKRIGYAALVLLTLGVSALLVARGPLYVTARTGYKCSACAAKKKTKEVCVVGFAVYRRASIVPSSLTQLRERLVAACEHSWDPDWGEVESWFGYREHWDCFAQFDLPACSLPDRIVAAIQRFPEKNARVKALDAIGTAENVLKWMAHEFLMEMAFVSAEEVEHLNWPEWWSRHSWAFEVCRDKEWARNIILQKVTDWSTYGASKTIALAEIDENDITSAPR